MKYLNEIAEILEIEDIASVSENDLLDEFNFDSLAAINLISFISEKSDIDIDPDEFEELSTIIDLDNFIDNKLSD